VKEIVPGIWEDDAGGLHFSIPQLLDAFGWEDTAANRAEVLALVRNVVTHAFPDATINEAD
jgi:hypothetical protein